MCAEPATLADFSKTNPVHPGQFCKTPSVLGMRSAVCAEAPANMAETTCERGAALTQDHHSPVVEKKRSTKRKRNPDNWKKKPKKPTKICRLLFTSITTTITNRPSGHYRRITKTVLTNVVTHAFDVCRNTSVYFVAWPTVRRHC